MLIIFGGLPGSGKSSTSQELAKKLKAVYLRIDSLETAIENSALNVERAEDSGYLAAYEIAKDNLVLNQTVIADSVNPIEISREGWRNVALKTGKKFIEIEVICSDKKTHRSRLENRNKDPQNTTPVTSWEEVMSREYEPWQGTNLQLDTSKMTVEECVTSILNAI